MAGINRARQISNESYKFSKSYASAQPEKPCIFLSHISIDKDAAIQIGDYINKYSDIDVYLDIYDEALQIAVAENDAAKITQNIERGITASTHVMCLISEKTRNSWWVPYELGFGKKSSKPLSSLKLKNTRDMPAYLEISKIIKGTKSLNEYLESIENSFNQRNITANLQNSLIKSTAANHPLDNYLDWQG